jgi:DNA-binding transcriptional MerR regulator
MDKILSGTPNIPDKLYFKIGEVSKLTELEAYVLRFWETEFKGIHPKRTESGQRLYRKVDVELILTIKHLLHEKRFTIQGAKQYLTSRKKGKDQKSPRISMNEIYAELKSVRDILSN